MSGGAFPSTASSSRRAVCIRPSCASLPASYPRSKSRGAVRCAPPFKRPVPVYPRDPRSGPGYVVPVHHHLTGPMRPTRRHSSISPHCGLYALPSLCALSPRLGDPRVDPCFRWHTFSTCRPPGPTGSSFGCLYPVPSPMTLAFDQRGNGLDTSNIPHPPILVGGLFSRLHYGSLSLRPVDLLAPLSELTGVSPSQRGLLLPGFRRIDHSLRRRI
jgi:hypothetical protein